jgi:hypothetical protein
LPCFVPVYGDTFIYYQVRVFGNLSGQKNLRLEP